MAIKNVYWDENELSMAPVGTATILAIGDSWFWYLFPGGSLLNQIGPMTESEGNVVLALGNNGKEAVDFVDGKYKSRVQTVLRLYGSGLRSVWISAGGNDVAGWDDFHPLLQSDCTGATTAEQCIRIDAFNFKMNDVLDAYTRLIKLIDRRTSVGCSIFLHNYAIAFPDGRGVFGGAAWIKPALDASRVPDHLHRPVVAFWIDQFTDVLRTVQRLYPGRIRVIDSSNALNAPNLWANELHPTPAGFKKIADYYWRPELVSTGLAK